MEVKFVVATHSNLPLRNEFSGTVQRSSIDRAGNPSVTVVDNPLFELTTLGYPLIENLTSEVLILVEGANDIAGLRVMIDKCAKGVNLRPYSFLPLGGDNMRAISLRALSGAFALVGILDSEPGQTAESARLKFSNEAKKSNVPVFQLTRRSLDNYWSEPAYRSLFKKYIDKYEEDYGTWSVLHDKSLEELGLPSSAKRKTYKLAQATELRDFEGTDLGRFMLDHVIPALIKN
jgi:hypothetical protein